MTRPWGIGLVQHFLRIWDSQASTRVDQFVAISKTAQERIRKYYRRDAPVIYPPPTTMANLSSGISQPWPLTDYFLIVSRLVAYKRIDLAISAFNDTGFPLKIIGSGVEEGNLKQMAKSNIEFIKEVSDEELFKYYVSSKALVFPGLEDFGLTMIEANYFGRPVIAFRGGGALDIVKEGVTGEFFDEDNAGSLKKVLEKFKVSLYNEKSCRENALRFSLSYFRKNIKAFIDKS